MRKRLIINSELPQSSDKKVCLSFKRELLDFVENIDKLLKSNDLCSDAQFLDLLSSAVIQIDRLSKNAKGCGEDLEIAAQLIQNVLTTELEGPHDGNLLSAAYEYHEKHDSNASFGKIMRRCLEHREETELLITSIRLIADEI